MKNEKISTNQNVYLFKGNNYPYLFFSIASSNGFIKNDYFYKETAIEVNEGEKQYNYVKSDFKVYEENSKIFKHIVNLVYYLLMVVILYSAYVSDTLIISIVIGTIIGIGLKYLINKGSTILILSAMILSIGIILYLLTTGTTDAPFAIFFYAILFYQIYENITREDLVYKIDSKPNGYYIWTEGKPIHRVQDMLGKKIISEDGSVLADFEEIQQQKEEE